MTTSTREYPTSLKALAALLFAALFFVGLQAPAAHAVGPVDVTVNLTSKSGTALSGVTIYAYPWANHAAKPFGTVVESQQQDVGTYLLPNLDPGQQYAIYFDAPGTATTAFDQFYGGTTFIEDATPKSWLGDSEFNVSLATNATITGTVKNSSNKAIAGVTVFPWRFDGSKWYRISWAAGTTNASGAYSLKNLEPGSYFVEFAPDNTLGYVGEMSGNKPLDVTGTNASTSAATKMYVGLGASLTASAGLATGGAISGSVGTVGFAPEDLFAVAYSYDTGSSTLDTSRLYFSKITGTSGSWKIAGLPSATYVVKLYDALYVPEFVDRWVNGTAAGAASPAGATKFVITAPGTKTTSKTTLNHLNNPGEDTSVDLTITHGGNPVNDTTTTVFIENADGDDTYYVLDSNNAPYQLDAGTFHFPFLPAGNYKVWVDPGDPAIEPFIGTRVVNPAVGTDPWTIDLPNASAFSFTTAPTVSPGTSALGTTYHVSQAITSLEPSADVDYSYIWLRNGAPIFGATGTSYTSRGVDVGAAISVLVRADTFGFGPIFQTLNAPTPTQGTAGSPNVFPTISAPANPVPGSLLTANIGTWDVPGLTFSYTWTRNDAVTLGTSRTYTVAPGDAGHTISLQVNSTAPGRPTGGASAGPPVAINSLTTLKNTTKPTITSTTSGQPAGFRKYTVSAGKWSLPSVNLTYEWRSAGNVVGSSNIFSCDVGSCPPSEVLEAVVTATKVGYVSASATVLARKAMTKPGISTSIAGEVVDATTGSSALGSSSYVDYGHVLQLTPPTYSVPPGAGTSKRTYQWQSSTNGTTWTNISKQTKTTYTPSSSLVGKHVRVLVTTTYANLGSYPDPFEAGTVQLKQDLVTGPRPVAYIHSANNYYDSKQYGTSFGPAYSVSGVAEKLQWYSCDPNVPGNTCSTGYPLGSDWDAVPGATSAFFTPGIALHNFRIMLVLTASKPGYASYFSAAGWVVIDAPGPATSTFMIVPPVMSGGITSGHATVGTKLTVKPGVADNVGAVVDSAWEVCPYAEVCTAFSSNWVVLKSDVSPHVSTTYVPTAADLAIGDTIRFNQFAHIPGHGGSGDSTAVYPLVGSSNSQTKAGKVTSSGITRTVTPGSWKSGTGTTFTYDWYLNGVLLVGSSPDNFYDAATGSLYVDITAHKLGYADASKRVVVLKGAPTAAANPLLNAAVYGDTLQANTAPFTFNVPVGQAKPTYKYQWYSGSSKISGATKATYTPSSGYVGKALKLKVTFSSAYYTTTPVTTNAITLGSHPAPTVGATISGIARPGIKLSVATTGVPSGSKLTYVWERSTNGSTGWTTASTSSTFTPGTTDVTKFLRVKVTSKKTGWITAPTTVSANVQVDYSPTITPSAAVTLAATKSPPVGSQLTVSAAFTTSGVGVSYEWFRNGVLIPGVTGTTWTPTASSFGDDIEVHVTATKVGYATQVFITNTVQVSVAAGPFATSKPVISDTTPQVGDVLTATPGAWGVDGLTFYYQWKIDGSNALGGNNSTFTVPSTNGVISVEVQASKTGWAGGIETSLNTAAVTVGP